MSDAGGHDHYEVLGVSRDASMQDIRRAYRTLALRCHPDVYRGRDAEPRFMEISDAYEVLHDPARGPSRVMTTQSFESAWSRSDRWMLVILPSRSSQGTPGSDPDFFIPAPAQD